MAIGRGSMTKELTGNRVKKKAMGGMMSAGGPMIGLGRAAAMSGRTVGKPAAAPAPTSKVMGAGLSRMGSMMIGMKKGGAVKSGMRGCGCATKGTKGGKQY